MEIMKKKLKMQKTLFENYMIRIQKIIKMF